jgi:hypothetical protein
MYVLLEFVCTLEGSIDWQSMLGTERCRIRKRGLHDCIAAFQWQLHCSRMSALALYVDDTVGDVPLIPPHLQKLAIPSP